MFATARGAAEPLTWKYESGVLLDGLADEWSVTHDPQVLAFIRHTVDGWLDPDGNISVNGKPLDPGLHTLDNIEPARSVLFVYEQTHDPRYKKAAGYIYAQFATQPRTPDGGFWHKQVYPNQMWLDGAYMAEPFRAAYAREVSDTAAFADIAHQFELMYEHTVDPASHVGLLHHGWDESKQMPWADKTTGRSQEAWARAMGWYAVALVDTLPSFPAGSHDRVVLKDMLLKVAAAIAQYQDRESGLWWDVLDKGSRTGNFREASASAMFVYALAKGVRLGYLPRSFEPTAVRGWQGIEERFITHDAGGKLTLHGTVKVSGLGGKPYRAGDYDYYIHEPVGDNDLKGMGAYLMAASEIMRLGPAEHHAPGRLETPHHAHASASTTP